MIVVMEPRAAEAQVEAVVARLKELGLGVHLSRGVERTIIGAIGEKKDGTIELLESMDGVEKVVPILSPFKLAGREFQEQPSVVQVGDVRFGAEKVVVIAGPCAVEGEAQFLEAAEAVKAAGATMLRGGAFKPRTSPYAFQGLGEEGLKILAEARRRTGLPVVSEVLDPHEVELVASYVDMLQVGARNMQNFSLLREIGKAKRPVLLKRGIAATVEEWLLAAEYVLREGNWSVVLCERGIRTYEPATRNTLDLSAVPLVRQLSHLPVVVDPSHAAGKWKLVPALAKAGLAAGADGVMLEVHPHPDHALSDGPQSLSIANFERLMGELRPLAQAVG
ncbi:MAG TPA: 3-deoxy-7-phosphoheptulonate synthase, partial [Firmicutes bacterium]|nr:3-deoxy-7-phosphoheptulonate synthase [Bacillota bacterium]